MAIPSINFASLAGLGEETRERKALVSLQDQVAEVYDSAREDVYRYIVLMGVAPEQAQEVCQEAFLRLYVALKKGQNIENARAWIFTVARHEALRLRASAANFTSLDPESEARLQADSLSPEQAVLDQERQRRLHSAVASLSDQQRECFHLRVEGFAYREIGEIIGVSTSTVTEFMRRAVSRLRKALYE
jgi:RNA polymerase sigma-70 factor (ECF subfamily)